MNSKQRRQQKRKQMKSLGISEQLIQEIKDFITDPVPNQPVKLEDGTIVYQAYRYVVKEVNGKEMTKCELYWFLKDLGIANAPKPNYEPENWYSVE